MRSQKFRAIATAPAFFALILFFVCARTARAQAGSGGISGTVADTTGAIIPGAKETAKNAATGTEISTVSTGGGLYPFVLLPQSTYEISAGQGLCPRLVSGL